MSAPLVPVDGQHPQPRTVEHAVEALRDGALLGYPSDTTYALGCDARQRRAVAAIRRAGGGVGYDHKGRPWAPAWLRKRLGDEFFQEVTSVQFLERSVTV